MTKPEKSAQSVINRCLEVKKGESVLILVTEPYLDIAQLLYKECLKKTKYTYIFFLPKNFHRIGIHASVTNFIQDMDIIIAVTTPSISPMEARIKANQTGTRIVSLPNITKPTFIRFANTDFKKINRLSKKLSDILSIAKIVNVISANGTRLQIPIENHHGYAETGLINIPGTFSHLPAGVACITPEAGKTEGELVVDSGMKYDREDPEKLILYIREGRAARIKGGHSAKHLRQKLAQLGSKSRYVIEFGIGTNDVAKICGNPTEDEKVLGNVYIRLGHNSINDEISDMDMSLHGIVYKATVEVKGKRIIEKGRLLLD
ncbi:hypothetical protein JXQ31_18205 [candidate division KSB1 bacterium]|nr:hypothetical protein [candidate division KSB1 bacterium]